MINSHNGSPAYAEAALADEIGIIGSTPKGRGLRNAAINRGAFKIGSLVGAGALSEPVAREALMSAARANGYVGDHGERSSLNVIEHGLKAGIASPRELNGETHVPQRVLAPPGRLPSSLPQRTAPNKYGKPKFCRWGDDGPPQRDDELRRHVYRQNGSPVRIKVKSCKEGQISYVNWYRVRDGNSVGWQPKQPSGFNAVPYLSAAMDPFDPELASDEIWWTEGEKDTDALSGLNVPSFTFGGCGDGLPEGSASYLTGRKIIIAADNDDAGREHALKKAAFAHAAGSASVKIIEFSELPPKGDVADFVAAGGTAEQLQDRAHAAAFWKSIETPALTFQTEQTLPVDHGNLEASCQLVMRCMADVEPEKIEWLWPGRIAIGKQTLIGGEPGLGKSQITAALASAVTTGGEWPCAEGRAPIGSVLILSAEDGAGDTIRPRLDAAGAAVENVHLITAVRQGDGKGNRTFSLQADLMLLERAIERIGNVRLVIIDPVSSYLGKTDSHKNADVRGTLEPLGDMASRLRVAVVSITHFSKGAGQSAVNSFIGSIAFVAAARAAFIVTPDPDNPSRRLFVQAKNNLAGDCGGLAYRIEQHLVGNNKDIVASAVTWEGDRISWTADQVLTANRDGDEKPERSEAEEFLREILSAGPRPSTEIEAEAKGAGVAWRTVRRAQKNLGIKPFRKAEAGDGLGKSGRWYWALPGGDDAPNMASFSYDGHVSNVDTLANSGHLSGNGGDQ